MTPPTNQKCPSCQNVTTPLTGQKLQELARQLSPGWQIVQQHHLEKEFKFKNFKDALACTNQVGELAERLQHHPDIYLAWGRVKLTLWTHKIDGLTESDFIFAAHVDAMLSDTH